MSNVKIVYKAILGGWFVVRGPHQTPIGGPHPTRQAAQQWLADRRAK